MKAPLSLRLSCLLLALAVGGVAATPNRPAPTPPPPPPTTPTPAPFKEPAKRTRHKHEGQAPHAGGKLGDPLADLTRDQLTAFTDGLGEFENVETPESGLGPIFNNTSCAICHSAPVTGGGSATLVTRFGRMDGSHFDPLTQLGGTLLQSKSIDPGILEVVPPEATIVAHRKSTPLFGAGLVEAIPDADIQAVARRTNKLDGVLGRAALLQDVSTGQMRVGRFGWKAQHATLLSFAADAYLNEMGITNRFFPTENAPNGDLEKLAQYDHTADPEDVVDPATGRSDIDVAADFMRYLAPPHPPKVNSAVQLGFNLFTRLGCAECHLPSYTTGPNKVRALDHKQVLLFSDLLLHDMGSLNDGIEQASTLANEMKTAPLWGLKNNGPYLHDGRAPTINDAIRAHDGEGQKARDRFDKLTASQQRQLLDFLNSL